MKIAEGGKLWEVFSDYNNVYLHVGYKEMVTCAGALQCLYNENNEGGRLWVVFSGYNNVNLPDGYKKKVNLRRRHEKKKKIMKNKMNVQGWKNFSSLKKIPLTITFLKIS